LGEEFDKLLEHAEDNLQLLCMFAESKGKSRVALDESKALNKSKGWGRAFDSGVTFSTDNLTATHASNDHNWVLSHDTLSQGKREWKCRIDRWDGIFMVFGVTHSVPMTKFATKEKETYGISHYGKVYKPLLPRFKKVKSGTPPKFQQGQTISCTLDLDNLSFTLRVIESGYSKEISGLPSGHVWYFLVTLYFDTQVTLI